jgi:hypothetical protein
MIQLVENKHDIQAFHAFPEFVYASDSNYIPKK